MCLSPTLPTASSPLPNMPSWRTYWVTPWSKIILQKLTDSQLVNKFPAFCGIWRFIIAFTSTRHLSLSIARSIQSMPHSNSWRSIVILSSHLGLGLPSGSFSQVSPPKPCMHLSSSPYVPHAPPSWRTQEHFNFYMCAVLRTALAQWLRCCATNRNVAGSIPDGVIGIFYWYNLSNRTMALESTQPLTEMSTSSISWG